MHPLKKYIYFETLDYTGSPVTSGYALPNTPFKFKAKFDDGITNKYSTQKIYWDFGDGNISQELEPVHYYTLPGWYNVTCQVLGASGSAFESSFSQSIYIKNFLTDNLSISAITPGKLEEGVPNQFLISRFNSWQSYESVSANGGYTILLNVSGNNAPYLDADIYLNEKWIHLKATSRFLSEEYDSDLGMYQFIPVNSVKTSNVELYVKKKTNNEIVFCSKTDPDAYFVGTSGQKIVYYIDDLPISKKI